MTNTQTSTTDLSAKDFQQPLLETLYELTNGQASAPVEHKDVYHPLCRRMGFTVDAFGQNPDGKDKTQQWAQWAYKNLKRTGHVEDAGRGKWALSEEGVKEAEKTMQTATPTPDPAPATDGVSSPVTTGQDESGYHADPYIRSLAAEATSCFGSYSDKADTCSRCPLQGPCINFLAADLSRLASVLDKEDKDADARAKFKAENEARAAQAEKDRAQVAAQPKQDAAPAGDWDWSQWQVDKARKIITKAESKCPRCNGAIKRDVEAVWVRSKESAGGRKRALMFHKECGPNG